MAVLTLIRHQTKMKTQARTMKMRMRKIQAVIPRMTMRILNLKDIASQRIRKIQRRRSVKLKQMRSQTARKLNLAMMRVPMNQKYYSLVI